MADIKQVKQDTLAIVDAALAILQRFPEIGESNTELSFNTSLNPFTFLMDLFKSTTGYNQIIAILTRFIAYQLPVVEAAVKSLLLSQLKDILSCSVNPLITEEILKDGIVFNIDEIDIADILKNSPFDEKIGKHFYFGTGEAHMPDDLVYCDDMDAFIWFVINKANKRYTWKPKEYRNKSLDTIGNTRTDNKTNKEGIITIEYYEKSDNLRDANGNDYHLQTPFNNCLHVFIGDAREDGTKSTMQELASTEKDISMTDQIIKDLDSEINVNLSKKNNIEQRQSELDKKLSNQEITTDEYKEKYKDYIDQLKKINNILNQNTEKRQAQYSKKRSLQYKIGNLDLKKIGKELLYDITKAKFEDNYYLNKTLFKFNIDYIASLRLFDEEVVAARLIDSLTGILTINAGFSYKRQLIKNEIKKMVSMIVETDDLVVSDCFFTFSNDDYDALSRQAELRKAGLLSINGDETSAVKMDPESILKNLNELNSNSSKETIQSVVEGTLTDLSKELTSTSYNDEENINFGVQVNFIENIMNQLAYVIVSAVLSPKIYLLLLINLKIIGQEPNFNLEQFLGSYKTLIANLIRAIRDQLLSYLVEQLMKIIGNIVKDVAYKLSIEQAKYYTRLIKQLVDCFKKHRDNLDYNIDDVDYADILADNGEPVSSEC